MSGDRGETPLRERLWVAKYDHSTDPPTFLEELFIENGVLMATKRPTDAQTPQTEPADAATVDVTEQASVERVADPVQARDPIDDSFDALPPTAADVADAADRKRWGR